MTARAHRGIALTALCGIAAVTVVWWALALYPAGAAAPAWLIRTRLACFGATPNGLPNAGGWVLLVGEPLGMVALLVAGWRDAIAADLRAVTSWTGGRALLCVAAGSFVWGALAAGGVVRRAATRDDVQRFAVNGTGVAGQPAVLDVPPLALIDQHRQVLDLRTLAGSPVLVTFAFAHCETVCPTIVHDVLRARRETGRMDIPLVIVTVDPWRDVPARLPSIALGWGLRPGDHLLSGDTAQVNAALDAWGIGRARDDATGDVEHAVTVILVKRGGRTAVRLDGSWQRLRDLLPKA